MKTQKEMIDLLNRYAWLTNKINILPHYEAEDRGYVEEHWRIMTRFAGALGLVE
tara:strand:- start:760 stop:921 length:162 start_codon:yes stop_codon:yes gene_type:complete